MKKFVSAGILVLALAARLPAQIVTNGNFNTLGTQVVGPGTNFDAFATWDEYIFTVGPTSLSDCQANSNSPVKFNLDAGSDYSLVIRAEPTVGCRSGVSQTLAGLTPGQTYRFGFNAILIAASGTNAVDFLFGGTTLLSQSFSNTAQQDFLTGSFVAAGTSGLFQIQGFTSTASTQVRIDDVFIDQVGGALAVTPEPATMMLMGTGLVTLAGAAGRKRRKR